MASVQSGNYLGNAAESAILGRTAAYREAVVTWENLMRAAERIESGVGPLS